MELNLSYSGYVSRPEYIDSLRHLWPLFENYFPELSVLQLTFQDASEGFKDDYSISFSDDGYRASVAFSLFKPTKLPPSGSINLFVYNALLKVKAEHKKRFSHN